MSYISKRDARMNANNYTAATGAVESREHEILDKIHRYFATAGRIDNIIPYIEEHKSAMSLRDFEAFNVHVSAWLNSAFIQDIPIPGTNGQISQEIFVVYHKYKAQLKAYNKETFDPFRRGINFEFNYTHVDENGEKEQRTVLTALCQLNYFLWCHSNNVLKYIHENYETISDAIQTIENRRRKESQDKFKDTISATQRAPVCMTNMEIKVFTPYTS